jgi:hypothetical protein
MPQKRRDHRGLFVCLRLRVWLLWRFESVRLGNGADPVGLRFLEYEVDVEVVETEVRMGVEIEEEGGGGGEKGKEGFTYLKMTSWTPLPAEKGCSLSACSTESSTT